MSYASAHALQVAVFDRLASDVTVTAAVDGHVYDALPSGPLPDTYVVIGAEDVADASDKSGAGAWHQFSVIIVSQLAGFAAAKSAAVAVGDALTDADLALSRGRLIALNFHKARARRVGASAERQITMTFRARVADDAQ